MRLPEENLLPPESNFAPTLLAPPLPPNFYFNPTLQVAKDLLGKGLVVTRDGHTCLAQIVETEAYLGAGDPASHAFGGVTRRNGSMFKEGGICYVYLSYGINFCMNVVTGQPGFGQAVLLRAAIPLVGLGAMHARRKTLQQLDLLNGPGKLCQGLGINLNDDGISFARENTKLVDLGQNFSSHEIAATARIGISKAKDEALRFVVKSSRWLSRRYVFTGAK